MTRDQLAIATSTVWVILAAILVMFMQAEVRIPRGRPDQDERRPHRGQNVLISPCVRHLLRRRIRPRVRRWGQRLRRRLRVHALDR
jgi:hypothetical protein